MSQSYEVVDMMARKLQGTKRLFIATRWATSYKWSYNPYKWPYKSYKKVTEVISPYLWVPHVRPFLTIGSAGPHLVLGMRPLEDGLPGIVSS